MPPSRRGGPRGPRQGKKPEQADERLWEDLARFVGLALERDELEPFGLPPDEAADLLLAAPAGADPVDAIAPQVASLERASAAADLLERLRDAPGLDGGERRAVDAASRLARDCVDDGALPDHPFWELFLAASLQRALTTGALLGLLLLPALDLEWVERAIARALAAPDVRRALEAAGATPPSDAHEAAELLGQLAVDDDDALPALGTDAALHLLRARHAVLSGQGEQLLASGVSPEQQRDLLARVEEAARADLTPELAAAVRRDALRLVETLREASPDDRAALVAVFLALAAPDPPHENQLLRGLLARALASPFLPEDEEELAVAVWADPNDRAALDAYERHLRARSPERADRVARFLRLASGT